MPKEPKSLDEILIKYGKQMQSLEPFTHIGKTYDIAKAEILAFFESILPEGKKPQKLDSRLAGKYPDGYIYGYNLALKDIKDTIRGAGK